MRTILLVLLILSSCAMHRKIGAINEISSEKIQMEIREDKLKNINISLRNNSDANLRFSSPECWVNSIPMLHSKSGIYYPHSIKIKANSKCAEKFIFLPPHAKANISFSYKLDVIYNNVPSGEYLSEFRYVGKVIDDMGKSVKIDGEILSNKLLVSF